MTVASANNVPADAPASAESAGAANAERLNPFQQIMLYWEGLHPYNAVHAAILRSPIEANTLRDSIVSACRDAGIGTMHVDRQTMTIRYESRGAPDIKVISTGGSIDDAIRRIAEEQINAPFPELPHHPIRWFLIEGVEHIALIAAYRHVAADANGLAALMASIIVRNTGIPRSGAPRLHTTPPDVTRASRLPTTLGSVANVARTISLYFRLRHSHKMPDEKHGGDRTTCVRRSPPNGLAGRLRAACDHHGVGLNDAVLAALGGAIAMSTSDRHVSRKRRSIALASAVSVRRQLGDAAAGYFGTLLGDMLVRLPNPDAAFEDVLRFVAQRTRIQKGADWAKAMRTAAARVFCVRTIWPLFRVPHDRRSYRKLFPVCGGVSTFSVHGALLRDMAPAVESYIRFCPPGPAMPLVLAPTILGDRLEFSLVFREACMDEARGAALLEDVVHRLSAFAEGGE